MYIVYSNMRGSGCFLIGSCCCVLGLCTGYGWDGAVGQQLHLEVGGSSRAASSKSSSTYHLPSWLALLTSVAAVALAVTRNSLDLSLSSFISSRKEYVFFSLYQVLLLLSSFVLGNEEL